MIDPTETLPAGTLVIFGRGRGEKTKGKVLHRLPGGSYKVEQLEARGSHPVGSKWTVPPSLMEKCADQSAPAKTPATSALTAPGTLLGSTSPAEKLQWTLHAPRLGLPADAYGKTFTSKGSEFRITGIAPNRPKYPVSAKRLPDGKKFKFDVASVTAGLLPATGKAPAATAKRAEDAIMKDILGVYCDLSPENLTCDGELSGRQVAARRRALDARLRELCAEIGRNVSESEAWAYSERTARA